ncbi:MAG: ABC transporter substrate-binding protein [Candidatus Saccharicenans sp.]|nr:ABC transporter substrate-binding protein [Candidatus Saccharicenans sp.]MDI6848524.1 ABC transporter substrate-binding protein [Candidatus Saccharicenans sp.]
MNRITTWKKSIVFLLFLLVSIAEVKGSDSTRITIKDSLGRQVKIPARVERIVCLQPELLRILVALEQQEKVVAVDRFPSRYDHILPIVFPEVANLPVVSITGEDANVEKILELKPDLVLISPSELMLSRNLSRKLNCPVVSLSAVGKVDDLLTEIEAMSRITGSEKRGRLLTDYLRFRLAEIKKKTSHIQPEKRPGVYLCFWGSLLRSPVDYEPVDLAGGRNLAGRFRRIHAGSDTAVLNLETLLSLDPEIILIHGNYLPEERTVTVETVLSDPRLQTVRAVRAKRVYYTFGFWYWWDPALVLIECLYLADLLSGGPPDSQTMLQAGDEIFSFFYRRSGLFRELCAKIKAYDWFDKKK